ncbi:hypothetical protein PUNSTDRAFT_94036 [Punctularia strigosozonata HHB-11173 SS5]|uniref:lytic cellulose monooxygenase (C4-dehydrogenating) n=1 Tax=Punctularia strigosozonata (strain HHB-11173) TaxID=741275 RepID=R7S106_PUNST|nr:uncharacterized protein PUNSTDRAFT_94036 [Punctularia strigosozonata HHB-11173 SS5]EIN03477.1 hypothetical protein PUNSTDRAFT_94036 [Punctularia strigosozonata HHB-11173 SS5]
MPKLTSTLLTLSALLAALAPVPVSAHGYVRKVAIDGHFYAGNSPNNETIVASPIRRIDDPSPIKGAANAAVNCGKNAAIAPVVAPANPGSMLTFDWAGGDDGNWPHNTGPMLTYMASCGNTTCDRFDSANASWFKIDEVGKKPDNHTWFQADLMQGLTHTVQLPSALSAGDYLVRHEIIALHLATSKGGAEFYASCTQLRVGGNGTASPASLPEGEVVKLPGAYKDTDPGIFDPTVFDTGANYTFPGPDVAKGLAAGASAITAPSNSTASGREPTVASVSSSASSSASSTKSTKTASSSSSSETMAHSARAQRYYPRRVSRVMRDLVDFDTDGPIIADLKW